MAARRRVGRLGADLEAVSRGDREELERLGRLLDAAPPVLGGRDVGSFLAEALLRVRDKGGALRALAANRAQRAFAAGRGRQNVVLKARQMGITTWVGGRFFLRTITRPGTLTVQVAHTRLAAEGIFGMVGRFWENLPEGLRSGAARRSKANAGQMVFPELDSEFRVESASDGNAGRGLTIQNLHCSELARWPGDAAETLAGLKAALAPEGELVMESTPMGAHGAFYDEWRMAEAGGVARHFFPWWMEEGYAAAAVAEESLTAEERGLVERHGLSLEQLGYRRVLEGRYRKLRLQEYAEDAEGCFLASGMCVFDLEAIDRRLREVAPPVETRMGGQLRIWFPALAGKEYVVGVDPAGGGAEGDDSAAQVVDLETGLQCAELQGKLGTLELARAVAELGREHNGALVAVERNNHGAGVLAYLDAVERYPRMYGQAGLAGWLTTVASRPGMVGRMGALLAESAGMFQSARLLRECRTFVRHGNGRTGAANGAHDDCVMAMAVAQAVRAELAEKRR